MLNFECAMKNNYKLQQRRRTSRVVWEQLNVSLSFVSKLNYAQNLSQSTAGFDVAAKSLG